MDRFGRQFDGTLSIWKIIVGIDLIRKLLKTEPWADEFQPTALALAEPETLVIDRKRRWPHFTKRTQNPLGRHKLSARDCSCSAEKSFRGFRRHWFHVSQNPVVM